MTTAMLSPFENLPAELRIRIWELTVEPRVVEVRMGRLKLADSSFAQQLNWSAKQPLPTHLLRAPIPTPAQLQVCREARELLDTHSNPSYRYEKAFSEVAIKPHEAVDALPKHDPQAPRYIWFNFGIDVVSICNTDLSRFWAMADQIRRLRLRRDITDGYFAWSEYREIGKWYKNLVEVQIIVSVEIRAAYAQYDEMDFPCGPEAVYWVDSVDGTMMNSFELDAFVLREYEELHGPLEHDS